MSVASGGFASGLRRTAPISDDIPFLASEHLQVKRSGATFQKGSGEDVETDNGTHSVIKAGTFCVPGDDDYFRPLGSDDGADAVTDTSGFIMQTIDVEHSDVTEGVMIHGSVLAARVTPSDFPDEVKDKIAGRITFQ